MRDSRRRLSPRGFLPPEVITAQLPALIHRIVNKVRGETADIDHMDPSSIALQALHQADTQLEKAAAGIANAGATSPNGTALDVEDLSSDMVALMSAQNLFEANLATLKTADQMQKNLLDLKG